MKLADPLYDAEVDGSGSSLEKTGSSTSQRQSNRLSVSKIALAPARGLVDTGVNDTKIDKRLEYGAVLDSTARHIVQSMRLSKVHKQDLKTSFRLRAVYKCVEYAFVNCAVPDLEALLPTASSDAIPWHVERRQTARKKPNTPSTN